MIVSNRLGMLALLSMLFCITGISVEIKKILLIKNQVRWNHQSHGFITRCFPFFPIRFYLLTFRHHVCCWVMFYSLAAQSVIMGEAVFHYVHLVVLQVCTTCYYNTWQEEIVHCWCELRGQPVVEIFDRTLAWALTSLPPQFSSFPS